MEFKGGLSVVIITRGRPGMLEACIKSLVSRGPAFEVLVGINGRDPASSAVLSSFGNVKVVGLPRMCRGEARNALAAVAGGRWLCFLDDDTLVPPGYFERLSVLIGTHPAAAVFGGGQELFPGAGAFESAVYALLGSFWGGGPFTERFSPVGPTRYAGPEKFILCNLTLDRDFLRGRDLAFEGHLTSAEENLLLDKMARAGARMLLSGDLNIVHRRRSGLRAFIRQVFSSGRGRAQITLLSPRSFFAFTLLPPAALFLLVLSAFSAPGLLGWGAGGYLAVSLSAAAFSTARAKVKTAVFALFPVLHVAYALGWFCGALEAALEKMFGGVTPVRCRCEEKS